MNTLLHTSTLAPTGQSSLCAVRFSSAVKVHKIRIHDGYVCSSARRIPAETPSEEDSLVLDVYFNCQLVPTPSEPKPKATNALVPTRIAHAGGTRDYYVNMTPQASRARLSAGFHLNRVAVHYQAHDHQG